MIHTTRHWFTYDLRILIGCMRETIAVALDALRHPRLPSPLQVCGTLRP